MPIEKKPMELSEDYQYVLNKLEKTRTPMFITGKAGTGKSTLLRLFRNTTKKKIIALAPTGVAALNVKGQTIHSFFGFPPKPLARSEIKKRRYRKLYEKIDIIIIDEISMVRADMLDNIDYFLRINRENPLPFGDVQMVFFGDLFQLPPVVATDEERMLINFNYDSPYFFSSNVIKGMEMEMMELRKVYRQEERQFIRLLDAVRLNKVDYDDIEDLNERHIPDFKPEEHYITLSSRNRIVDSINKKELDNIPLIEFTYLAKIDGNFQDRLFPTDAILKLKLGAQVMFIRNDAAKKFVNGTIGKVVHLDIDKIKVEINDNGKQQIIDVEKEEWEITKYKVSEKDHNKIESSVMGTFTQYPLKAAWAITIHKSQGKTFDRVIIDMGRGAFEHGQTYVALSRCRTLNGIVLKQKLSPRDILVDERVVEYYEQMF
jgi:ATP-dependent DNA helicase PIF1